MAKQKNNDFTESFKPEVKDEVKFDEATKVETAIFDEPILEEPKKAEEPVKVVEPVKVEAKQEEKKPETSEKKKYHGQVLAIIEAGALVKVPGNTLLVNVGKEVKIGDWVDF